MIMVVVEGGGGRKQVLLQFDAGHDLKSAAVFVRQALAADVPVIVKV
jgi:hypothetical protein